MAFLFGCEKLHLEYPTKVVFDSLTLGVDAGDRIGVVGRNGDGKSSLLGLFDGSIIPDEGQVFRTGNLRFASLRQVDSLSDTATVSECVVGSMPEYEWAASARIREIIEGLIADIPWDALVGTLSGGQRRRVDLARVLVDPADVVLLDEPTNHLDVGAINWLAQHLKARFSRGVGAKQGTRSGALVVVTHDRWFLDEVCQRMLEIHDGVAEPFEGGYSAYILQRVERQRLAAQAEKKRQNLLRRELAWLSRGARARATKPKFHVDAARALVAQEPPLRDFVELKRAAISRLGKRCIEVCDVSFSFGEQAVLNHIDWLVGPGDRYGLLGANGVGKSTLLDIIRGKLLPQTGHVRLGKTVKIAFLSQRLEELEAQKRYRVREILSRYKARYVVEGKEVSPAKLLERLGFTNKHLNMPVGELSGGQRRRLQLMLILLDSPNVLILDEPSNDLDTDMLVAVENLLDTWPGTLILVTHDRYLMERVTDNQFALIDGRLRHVPRGVDEYLELLEAQQKGPQRALGSTGALRGSQSVSKGGVSGFAGMSPKVGENASKTGSQKADFSALNTENAQKGLDGLGSGLAAAEARELRRRLHSLERKMNTARDKLAKVKEALSAANPTDYVALEEAQAQVAEHEARVATLEDEWLEVAQTLEG